MDRVYIPTAERYGRDVPILLRWLRCFHLDQGCARFSWGEISWRYGWGFALEYSVYHDSASFRFQFIWPTIYLKAPMLIRQRPGTEDWHASYGFSTFEDAIHLNWRLRCKIIHMPWSWSHVRWSVFDGDGNKHPVIHEYGKGAGPYEDGRHVEQYPFVYVLRSGEIQNRIATIWGEEMEWRWLWFKWMPWPRKINRSIHIDFSDEVGERSGSWKGGVTGCSFDWRNGESMRSCLQRMQHEREFR